MKRKSLALAFLATLLGPGCMTKDSPGWVGFVINQDQKSSSNSAPGKSYTAGPATLLPAPDQKTHALQFEAGSNTTDIQLKLEIPVLQIARQDILGKTLPIQVGSLRLPQQSLEFDQGSFTMQTLSGGVARGNFNARVKNHNPPWEIVGSFEAPCGIL